MGNTSPCKDRGFVRSGQKAPLARRTVSLLRISIYLYICRQRPSDNGPRGLDVNSYLPLVNAMMWTAPVPACLSMDICPKLSALALECDSDICVRESPKVAQLR